MNLKDLKTTKNELLSLNLFEPLGSYEGFSLSLSFLSPKERNKRWLFQLPPTSLFLSSSVCIAPLCLLVDRKKGILYTHFRSTRYELEIYHKLVYVALAHRAREMQCGGFKLAISNPFFLVYFMGERTRQRKIGLLTAFTSFLPLKDLTGEIGFQTHFPKFVNASHA